MENDNELTRFGYGAEDYKKFKVGAWKFLVGFSLLYCFLYCCRLNLAAAMPAMIEEEGWTTAQLGILSGIFFWTYGMGHLFNGRLGEIFGVNRFVIGSVILSAAANIFVSFQSSIVIMAIAWAFNGYFQSMAWSPGMAVLTRWWPGDKRGFATGFGHAFSGFGQAACILAVAFSFSVAPSLGWRAAFIIPTLFPLSMLIIYKICVKPTPTSIGLEEYVEEDPVKAAMEAEMKQILATKGKLYPYLYLVSNWRFVIWMIIAFCTGLARYGLVTWVPLYFITVFDVDIKAGLIGTLGLPLGMGIGTLVVPWLTDRFCPTNRLPAVISSGAIAAVAVYLFYLSEPGFFVTCLLFIAGFFIYAINGLAWAFATDVGGRVFSGTAAGVLDCAAYMGAAVQAIYFGFALKAGGWGTLYIAISAALILLVVLSAISGAAGKKGNKKADAACSK